MHFIELFKIAEEVGDLAFDIESSHPTDSSLATDVWREGWQLDGIGLATEGVTRYTLDMEECREIAKAIWKFQGVVHNFNIKFDLMGLKKFFGLSGFPENIACTMIGYNIINENISPHELALKPLIKKIFNYDMIPYEEAAAAGRDSELFAQYCMDDARQERKLFQHVFTLLTEQNLLDLFFRIQMPMVKVVADMELLGFRWDLGEGQKLMEKYLSKTDSIEKELRSELGPNGFIEKKVGKKGKTKIEPINFGSGDQLATLLFDVLGISKEGVPMTKSGKRVTVAGEALEAIADRHPICQKLVDLRHATDMLSKYVGKISECAMEDVNNRTHPSTWLTSATGRTRQTDPPNQTIPKYPKFFDIIIKDGAEKQDFTPYRIRNGFRAREGCKIVKADFSGMQLRIMAHASGDPAMSDAFLSWQCTECGKTGKNKVLLLSCPNCGALANEKILKGDGSKGFWHGKDLHSQTMNEINKRLSAKALENRDEGKMSNFALIFMATGWKMNMEYPKFSIRKWDQIIEGYFEVYAGVRAFHKRVEKILRNKLEVIDMFGRRRRFTEEDVDRHWKHTYNQAVNILIQAPEVEIAQLCCADIREKQIKQQIWSDGRLQDGKTQIVQFMHDEIVQETPDELVPIVSDMTLNTMRYRVALNIPLDAELSTKESW